MEDLKKNKKKVLHIFHGSTIIRHKGTIYNNCLVGVCSQKDFAAAGLEENMEFAERKRWLFLGLPFTFTKYYIKENMITVRAGLFKTIENDCYMYKVQDVQHSASLIEKMFRLGTVTCFTGDTTHPQLVLSHIKNSRPVKEFILEQSEEARVKRRTVNMLDIGSGDMQDMEEADINL